MMYGMKTLLAALACLQLTVTTSAHGPGFCDTNAGALQGMMADVSSMFVNGVACKENCGVSEKSLEKVAQRLEASIESLKTSSVNSQSDFDLIYQRKFIKYGDSSYFFALVPAKRELAEKVCKNLGANLVVIDSYDEDQFLTEKLTEIETNFSRAKDIRTFFTDGIKQNGVWVWGTTNKPIDYVRWGATKPDGHGDCHVYDKSLTPLWMHGDRRCAALSSFICEKKTT